MIIQYNIEYINGELGEIPKRSRHCEYIEEKADVLILFTIY